MSRAENRSNEVKRSSGKQVHASLIQCGLHCARQMPLVFMDSILIIAAQGILYIEDTIGVLDSNHDERRTR